MSQTIAYIKRLEALEAGERSRLRALAGQRLDARLDGFDLFTGLWWPLRQASPVAPRRETSWLVAKLFGAFGSAVPHNRPEGQKAGPTLPEVLGVCEPRDPQEVKARDRFRTRFDALLCSPLSGLEPHLRWALGEVARAKQGSVPHARGVSGIDWAVLLDDLSLWDRTYNPNDTHQKSRINAHMNAVGCGEEHASPQDLWACAYLRAAGH